MEVSPIAEVLDGKQEWCLIQGDCLDKLREIPSGTIDAVVADPPYGISYRSRTKGAVRNDHRPFIWWLYDAYRVLKRRGALICFCRWDVQEVFRVAIEAAGFTVRSQVVWDRMVHSAGNVTQQFAPRHDVAWFATRGPFRFPGRRPQSVIQVRRVDYRDAHHPTEKPFELMRQLVTAITPVGGVVLDPCAGSGSTGLAAVWEGRRFIGIELDETYAATATNRLFEISIAAEAYRLVPDDPREAA